MKEPIRNIAVAQIDQDTLRNLGPLRPMAGLFISQEARDTHLVDGEESGGQFRDEYVLSPIDPQIVGGRVLYGLRYLQYARRHGSVAMLDDQVGYWLWDALASTLTMTQSTPRGDVLVATGTCEANAAVFTLRATRESTDIADVPASTSSQLATTVSFALTVTIVDDDSWRYVQETLERVPGQREANLHRKQATLVRVSHAPANASMQLP